MKIEHTFYRFFEPFFKDWKECNFCKKLNIKSRVVAKKFRGIIRYHIFIPEKEAAYFIDLVKPTYVKFGCMLHKLGTRI